MLDQGLGYFRKDGILGGIRPKDTVKHKFAAVALHG